MTVDVVKNGVSIFQPLPGSLVATLDSEPIAVEGGPRQSLYHPSLGVFGFQADGVARCYLRFAEGGRDAVEAIWSTGIGKTHLAMGLACLMIEDDVIDTVIVVAEQNKVADWAKDDIPKHTDLTVGIYMGAKRKKLLEEPPQVLVTTYETYRNDVATFRPRSLAVTGGGPLLDWMKTRRTLLVYDEVTKLRGRSSKLHISHDYALNRVLRREKIFVVTLGLTATSIERSPEDLFNVARVLAPDLAGTVESFNTHHIKSWDVFGNPYTFKNIWNPGSGDTPWDGTTVPLVDRLAPLIIRKRKSDPDVRDQFPAMIEEPPEFIALSPKHAAFYEAVEESYGDADPYEQRVAFGLLRQIAGHPLSLLRTQGKDARQVFDIVGEPGLRAMGCAKEDRLVERILRLAGDQIVVFTFYGQSILPLLADRMHREGITFVTNHGGLSAAARFEAQRRFKAGDVQVFLSSDAGARGLNLGVGAYLDHYELPLMFSTYRQRSDRIHRIDSSHDSVTVGTLVAEGTVEENIGNLLMRRNEWSDAVDHRYSDDDIFEEEDPGDTFISAETRATLLRRARSRSKG